jgi:hypothetical protein
MQFYVKFNSVRIVSENDAEGPNYTRLKQNKNRYNLFCVWYTPVINLVIGEICTQKLVTSTFNSIRNFVSDSDRIGLIPALLLWTWMIMHFISCVLLATTLVRNLQHYDLHKLYICSSVVSEREKHWKIPCSQSMFKMVIRQTFAFTPKCFMKHWGSVRRASTSFSVCYSRLGSTTAQILHINCSLSIATMHPCYRLSETTEHGSVS